MSVCYYCGAGFPDNFEVYKTTECPSCGRDAKVCKNCSFYSPGSKWDCRETVPEDVRDKERANFCDYFRLGGAGSGGKMKKKAEDARSAFDSLFGNE